MESSVIVHDHALGQGAPVLRHADWHGHRARDRSALLARLLAAADLLAGVVAGMFAALAFGMTASDALAFALTVAFVWPAVAFTAGLYSGRDLQFWVTGISEVPKTLVAALLSSWPLFAAAGALGAPSAAGLTAAGLAATLLLSGAGRSVGRALAHRVEPLRQRTVVVGSGRVAGRLVEKLNTHSQFGLVPIGLVDDDVCEEGSPALPRLGDLEGLREVIELHGVDRVIIAFSLATHEQLLHSIRVCRDAGVTVSVVPRLFELLDGARSLDQVGGLPLLTLGTASLGRVSRVAKRALDIAVAGSLIVVAAPLFLVLAIAVRAESRGPVLFRQLRVGQNGRIFKLLKMRSMYDNADQLKSDLLEFNDVDDGVMFKMRQDPRITKVGRFLRRFSLDELPQLLNVLRGEMSLVGPRPLVIPEADALHDWHARRLDLRPGLTGPWQIQGRSENPFQEMVSFDYQYVAGWSLARDVEILLATLPVVLSGRGAY